MRYEILGNTKQADLNVYVCERDDKLGADMRYGPVIRDSYILECCTEGCCKTIINGKPFFIKPGNCAILLPGDTVIHMTEGDVPRSGLWCAVKGMKISSYVKALGIDSNNPFAPSQAFDKVLELLNDLLEAKSENDPGADLRRTSCIHAIFGEMLRYAKADPDKSIYIQRARHIIETRYNEQISVSGLARAVGLERSYFSTLFKKVTGVTPQEYITDIRIKKACTLLSMDEYSVSEAASAVGITPEGFSRVFKNKMGITPSSYRDNQKAINTQFSKDWVCGQ